MNRNTAILIVSFGTAVKASRARTLDSVESDIRHAFPEHPVYHAWTSRMLRKKVWDNEQLSILSISDAMAQMANDGVTHVIVQPTFVTAGAEYRQMVQELECFAGTFDSIQTGTPLLGIEPQDKVSFFRDIPFIRECPTPSADELLIFMGHGTADGDDLAYESLNQEFHSLGHTNIFLKTMKSSSAIDEVIQIARERRIRNIILAPFMIVAGGHALKDMSGDSESSWKSRLETAGFSVQCMLKGLGEYECIRQWFVRQIESNIEM